MKTIANYILFTLLILLHLNIFPTETGTFDRPLLSMLPFVGIMILNSKYVLNDKLLIAYFIIMMLYTFVASKSIFSVAESCWGFTLLCLAIKCFNQKSFKYSIIFLFGLEMILSLYEYSIGHNFFAEIELDFTGRFRSTGLWGHPLNNAIIISAFILLVIMADVKSKYKLVTFFCGMLTLFCFNARASILSTLVCAGIYFLLKNKGNFAYHFRRQKIYYFIFIILIGFTFSYLSQSELGGKLFISESRNFEDGSAQVRLEALSFFQSLSINDILFGLKDYKLSASLYGLMFIENSLLILIFQYGILLAVFMMTIIVIMMYRIMGQLKKKERVILIFNILFIGFTSPALCNFYVYIFILFAYQALFECKTIKSVCLEKS